MLKTFSQGRVPIKLWAEDIEAGAMVQALNLSNLPFAHKHIALMPDCHQGFGMPIGGVLATEGVVIPNAVGVDIGCGMCAVRTSLEFIAQNTLKAILGSLRNSIPLGFKHHKESQDRGLMPDRDIISGGVVDREYKSALKQLGTLGGGNHFIELQQGNDGYIWLMIHSGSRNLGKQVADYYNRLAVGARKRFGADYPKQWQLDFLPIDSDEGQDYLSEMQYCVDFALANRKLMMQRFREAVAENINEKVEFDDMINIAHNFAEEEKHFGKNVYVHRKGATKADKGRTGIIPGSQGMKSHIVEGRGNPDSFNSCSHGAGRKMGRKQAQRKLNLAREIKMLDKQGILHSIRHKSDLDEAPGAYKDIHTVMRNQSDLVKILVELSPLAVLKG